MTTTAPAFRYVDSYEVIRAAARRGSHYFDTDNVRGFSSTWRDDAVRGPGGTYLATSDRGPGRRYYRVVRFGVDGSTGPVSDAEATALGAASRGSAYHGDATFRTFAAADAAARLFAAARSAWTPRHRLTTTREGAATGCLLGLARPINPRTDEPTIDVAALPFAVVVTGDTLTPEERDRLARLIAHALDDAEIPADSLRKD